MGELSRLPNIGKEVERQLNEAGVLSAEDLKNLGAKKAWLKIQKLDPSACRDKQNAQLIQPVDHGEKIFG